MARWRGPMWSLSFKVVLFVFKIFKIATNIKILKIRKWTDFNVNGYLQGVRHATLYGDHFGLLWWPFWTKNGHQNTKILRFWAKFGFQVDYDVANWYPSFGSHIMILKIISYLVISSYVLTLFFIHTTSTCIVRFGDICSALVTNILIWDRHNLFKGKVYIQHLAVLNERRMACLLKLNN